MDIVLHLIGTCADTHSHFDLLDLFLIGGSSVGVIGYFKFKLKSIIDYVKRRKLS